jgi:hypothetical protein
MAAQSQAKREEDPTVRGPGPTSRIRWRSRIVRRMTSRVPFLACLMLVATAAAAPPALQTREQVEQLLARDLASGSSAATVARFLDERGIAHGKPVAAGPTVQLTGSVPNLRSTAAAGRVALQVHFSFLQDRLIGYSFTEQPAVAAAR